MCEKAKQKGNVAQKIDVTRVSRRLVWPNPLAHTTGILLETGVPTLELHCSLRQKVRVMIC